MSGKQPWSWQKSLESNVEMPTAPFRVPSQMPRMSRLSTNDKSDNEMEPGNLSSLHFRCPINIAAYFPQMFTAIKLT